MESGNGQQEDKNKKRKTGWVFCLAKSSSYTGRYQCCDSRWGWPTLFQNAPNCVRRAGWGKLKRHKDAAMLKRELQLGIKMLNQ